MSKEDAKVVATVDESEGTAIPGASGGDDGSYYGHEGNDKVSRSYLENSRAIFNADEGTSNRDSRAAQRPVEEHEFIVASKGDSGITIDFGSGSQAQSFVTTIEGLESIGVYTPVVNDRYLLQIFKSPFGYRSRAIKIGSESTLQLPMPAPEPDPSYLEKYQARFGKNG